uniref:Recep_L_domain domain-containing protein n=1 Tax=Caenorhabditis tropicalis TaxID=1561998 RepID=A0A1I7U658_9PELO
MQKEIIIVPPTYFTVISNVGLIGCKDVEQPMLLLISGEFNTSGTIAVNVLEYPSSVKMLVEDMVIYYFYPMLFGIFFAVGGCALSSIICYGKHKLFAKINQQRKTWTEYAQFKFETGPRGTFV